MSHGGAREGAGAKPLPKYHMPNADKAQKLIGDSIVEVTRIAIEHARCKDKRVSMTACKLLFKYYLTETAEKPIDNDTSLKIRELISNIPKEGVQN